MALFSQIDPMIGAVLSIVMNLAGSPVQGYKQTDIHTLCANTGTFQ